MFLHVQTGLQLLGCTGTEHLTQLITIIIEKVLRATYSTTDGRVTGTNAINKGNPQYSIL